MQIRIPDTAITKRNRIQSLIIISLNTVLQGIFWPYWKIINGRKIIWMEDRRQCFESRSALIRVKLTPRVWIRIKDAHNGSGSNISRLDSKIKNKSNLSQNFFELFFKNGHRPLIFKFCIRLLLLIFKSQKTKEIKKTFLLFLL